MHKNWLEYMKTWRYGSVDNRFVMQLEWFEFESPELKRASMMVCLWNHNIFPVRWGSEMEISQETLSLTILVQTVVNRKEMLSKTRLKVKTDTWGCLLIFTLVLCTGICVHMCIHSYRVYAQRKDKNKQTYKWKTILSFVPFKVNIDCKV